MARDGKSKFYRQLELDRQAKEAIRLYRMVKKLLMKDSGREESTLSKAR